MPYLQIPNTVLMTGESLSLYQPPGSDTKWAIITPFAHPGDKIRAKICKHDRFYSAADLVEILDYSEEYRGGEGDRRKYPENGCKYFGEWYVFPSRSSLSTLIALCLPLEHFQLQLPNPTSSTCDQADR